MCLSVCLFLFLSWCVCVSVCDCVWGVRLECLLFWVLKVLCISVCIFISFFLCICVYCSVTVSCMSLWAFVNLSVYVLLFLFCANMFMCSWLCLSLCMHGSFCVDILFHILYAHFCMYMNVFLPIYIFCICMYVYVFLSKTPVLWILFVFGLCLIVCSCFCAHFYL